MPSGWWAPNSLWAHSVTCPPLILPLPPSCTHCSRGGVGVVPRASRCSPKALQRSGPALALVVWGLQPLLQQDHMLYLWSMSWASPSSQLLSVSPVQATVPSCWSTQELPTQSSLTTCQGDTIRAHTPQLGSLVKPLFCSTPTLPQFTFCSHIGLAASGAPLNSILPLSPGRDLCLTCSFLCLHPVI